MSLLIPEESWRQLPTVTVKVLKVPLSVENNTATKFQFQSQRPSANKSTTLAELSLRLIIETFYSAPPRARRRIPTKKDDKQERERNKNVDVFHRD